MAEMFQPVLLRHDERRGGGGEKGEGEYGVGWDEGFLNSVSGSGRLSWSTLHAM